jgi:hypothetical protein
VFPQQSASECERVHTHGTSPAQKGVVFSRDHDGVLVAQCLLLGKVSHRAHAGAVSVGMVVDYCTW